MELCSFVRRCALPGLVNNISKFPAGRHRITILSCHARSRFSEKQQILSWSVSICYKIYPALSHPIPIGHPMITKVVRFEHLTLTLATLPTSAFSPNSCRHTIAKPLEHSSLAYLLEAMLTISSRACSEQYSHLPLPDTP